LAVNDLKGAKWTPFDFLVIKAMSRPLKDLLRARKGQLTLGYFRGNKQSSRSMEVGRHALTT
jgi:hypothetical protein